MAVVGTDNREGQETADVPHAALRANVVEGLEPAVRRIWYE